MEIKKGFHFFFFSDIINRLWMSQNKLNYDLKN